MAPLDFIVANFNGMEYVELRSPDRIRPSVTTCSEAYNRRSFNVIGSAK
jgi:hypothetical protein